MDAILKTGPVLVALAELNRQLGRQMHPRLGAGNLHGSLMTGGLGNPPSPTGAP